MTIVLDIDYFDVLDMDSLVNKWNSAEYDSKQ